MNQVQAIFERDIGLTFTISFQHTWDTANDPYNANGDAAASTERIYELLECKLCRLAGRRSAYVDRPRFRRLGRVAWTGVVCRSPTNSYGISDRETIAPFEWYPGARNWAQLQCQPFGQAECANTIMVSIQDQNNGLRFAHFQLTKSRPSSPITPAVLGTAPAVNPMTRPTFSCGNTTRFSWDALRISRA